MPYSAAATFGFFLGAYGPPQALWCPYARGSLHIANRQPTTRMKSAIRGCQRLYKNFCRAVNVIRCVLITSWDVVLGAVAANAVDYAQKYRGCYVLST